MMVKARLFTAGPVLFTRLVGLPSLSVPWITAFPSHLGSVRSLLSLFTASQN